MTTCHRATYARPKPYRPKASTPSPRAMATWIARPSRVDPRIPAPALSTLPAKPFMAGSPRSRHKLQGYDRAGRRAPASGCRPVPRVVPLATSAGDPEAMGQQCRLLHHREEHAQVQEHGKNLERRRPSAEPAPPQRQKQRGEHWRDHARRLLRGDRSRAGSICGEGSHERTPVATTSGGATDATRMRIRPLRMSTTLTGHFTAQTLA